MYTGGTHLAALAVDEVAASILLHRFAALGTRLCVGHDPILCLTVIPAFLLPTRPPATTT